MPPIFPISKHERSMKKKCQEHEHSSWTMFYRVPIWTYYSDKKCLITKKNGRTSKKHCPDVENVRTSPDKEFSVFFVRNLLSSIGNNFLILSYSPFSLFLLARAASADRSFRNFANLIIIWIFSLQFRTPYKILRPNPNALSPINWRD